MDLILGSDVATLTRRQRVAQFSNAVNGTTSTFGAKA
jgi:hypothetical protein